MFGIWPDDAVGLERQADALEQAEQVEFALRPHVAKHLLGREVLDPDHQVFAKRAELGRQPGIGLRRQRFEFGQRRRARRMPGRAWDGFGSHLLVLWGAAGAAKPFPARFGD